MCQMSIAWNYSVACWPSLCKRILPRWEHNTLQLSNTELIKYTTVLHTQPLYGCLDFVWDYQVSQYQKKHSPTHTHPDHQSSFIRFLHLLRFMASSLFNLRDWQSFCTTSVQVFLCLPFGPLHTAHISSPSHCLLFAAHAHTISACFAVVPSCWESTRLFMISFVSLIK